MKAFLFNIQKYSLHDGDGIRTNIFFKGCPLRCVWCANPESQEYWAELLWNADKCIGCGACAVTCPRRTAKLAEDCRECLLCTDVCCAGARVRTGKQYSTDEVMEKILADELFYRLSGGGVTFTGGEPFSQPEALCELAERLGQEGIRTAVETCGYVEWESILLAAPLLDAFLYDIKLMDPEKHKKYTGADNVRILSNLKKLAALCGDKITVRVPLIGGVNDDKENLEAMLEWLKKCGLRRIDFLPYHRMGETKYMRLRRAIPEKFAVPAPEQLEIACRRFMEEGFDARLFG